jgi:hypothetical protein
MTNLAALLMEVNGTSFVSIDTETEVKLTGGKKNPHQGHVTKRVVGSNVMVFQNKKTNGYENMVRRRLEAEGKNPATFVLSPRTWGQRLEGAPFIEHNGNYYIEVIFLHPGKVEYLLDGVVVPKSTIQGLPAEKEEASQGGLSDKVVIRTYKADSIKAITINKHHYDGLTFSLPH